MVVDILKALKQIYQDHDYKLFNTYIFDWEADFFCVEKRSKFTIEIEVKTSHSDYKADFKKEAKHRYLTGHKHSIIVDERMPFHSDEINFKEESSFISFCQPQTKIPNRFYYACPEGVIKANEVPKYAGLYYYNPNYDFLNPEIFEVKHAPLLHNLKHDKTDLLLVKYYNQHLYIGERVYQLEKALYDKLDEPGRKLLQDFMRKLSY